MIGTIEYGWTLGSADGPLTFDELRESIRRIIGVDVPIAAPKGPGPHALRRLDGINSRLADRYRVGRVLLLGDAAHVHSPMGGPGLNLGMQDAVNLGWKLAAVVTGRAPDGLLDTYESERYPVGERVMMHSQAQLALAAPGPEVEALRSLFAELVGKPEVTKHMAGLLAGSDVRYDVGDGHRLSGLMVPDLDLDDGRRVVELLHDGRPVLIDATGGAASAVAAGVVGSGGHRCRGHIRRPRRDAHPARWLCRMGRRRIGIRPHRQPSRGVGPLVRCEPAQLSLRAAATIGLAHCGVADRSDGATMSRPTRCNTSVGSGFVPAAGSASTELS